jgi:hypothetical protein
MDTAWEPVGERFHKSSAFEDEYNSYTRLKHHTSKLITFFRLTEDDDVKVPFNLNLPSVDRGRETPLIMTCCITEGHSSISFSSGVVSIPLRLVCF